MKKTLKFHLISILAVLGFVFFWYLMTDVLHRVNTLILPGPVDVFRAFLNKMTNTRPDGGGHYRRRHFGHDAQFPARKI